MREVRHANEVARVVDVRVPAEASPPGGFTSEDQVVLTYQGLFGYQVGRRTRFYDTNRTLFATRDQQFQDSHPVKGLGHGALVIIPGSQVREELFGALPAGGHPMFLAAAAPASARLRLMTHLLRTLVADTSDTLRADEAIVAAVVEALPAGVPQADDIAGSSRVVDRARQLLHAREPGPLSLPRFAREVGCSPAYLTREFTRVEGQPLYRYQLNLRLNEALLRLPGCDSITELALDLGFSSHAHLTAAFTATFAMSPSQFRAQARSRRPPLNLPGPKAA